MNNCVWCLMAQDDWHILNGQSVKFLLSVHATRKGALKERERLKRLDVKRGRRYKIAYTLEMREVLPEGDKPADYRVPPAGNRGAARKPKSLTESPE